jgi:hypothetical protein
MFWEIDADEPAKTIEDSRFDFLREKEAALSLQGF